MELSNISLDEYGQVTCTDEQGRDIFLQLPITPESQNSIDGEFLDWETAKEYQAIIDEHFGGDDRTLARLCYAGGKVYESYEKVHRTVNLADDIFGGEPYHHTVCLFVTNTGDEFVEADCCEHYHVEAYKRYDGPTT